MRDVVGDRTEDVLTGNGALCAEYRLGHGSLSSVVGVAVVPRDVGVNPKRSTLPCASVPV